MAASYTASAASSCPASSRAVACSTMGFASESFVSSAIRLPPGYEIADLTPVADSQMIAWIGGLGNRQMVNITAAWCPTIRHQHACGADYALRTTRPATA